MLDRSGSMAYNDLMDFEWDEAKSDACFVKRGFDFPYVAQVFLDAQRVVRTDVRFEYGEERFQLLGAVDGRIYQVAYTMRGRVIRIISARKANLREVKLYENGAF
jgi:uncharacterized protein